jgi:hypothetical protein
MTLRIGIGLILALALGAGTARADVLTTTDGLALEGRVEKLPDGRYRVTTEDGRVELAARQVASVRRGIHPRADLRARARALDPHDALAFTKLALEAEGQGLADVARELYEHVLTLDPDQAAARRALGYERHEGAWVRADVARRRKGLVLYRGRWMLPAEVERVARRTPSLPAAADVDRAKDLVRTLAHGAKPLRHAARLALARTERAVLLPAALGTLYDKDPEVRIVSAQVLAEIGDESALRPLIFSGARDLDARVRREAVLAAQSFGHDDTAVPYVRALGSRNLRLAANAAQALGLLADQRAAPYIVKILRSHGSSTRNVVSFLHQVSYVRDYDVEVAQASNIANPDVARLQEGIVLDVRVLDASITKVWLEPLLVKAFSQIVGQDLRSAGDVEAWYAEHGDTLPSFPVRPAARAPRHRAGTVVGAPLR